MSTERIEAQLRNISIITRHFLAGRCPPSTLELIPAQAESARLDLQRLRGEFPATIGERVCAYWRGLIRKGV